MDVRFLLESMIKEIFLESQDDEDHKSSLTSWVDRTYEGDFESAAKKLGVSKSHLYKIARGDASPSFGLAAKMKSGGVQISDLERAARKSSKKKHHRKR